MAKLTGYRTTENIILFDRVVNEFLGGLVDNEIFPLFESPCISARAVVGYAKGEQGGSLGPYVCLGTILDLLQDGCGTGISRNPSRSSFGASSLFHTIMMLLGRREPHGGQQESSSALVADSSDGGVARGRTVWWEEDWMVGRESDEDVDVGVGHSYVQPRGTSVLSPVRMRNGEGWRQELVWPRRCGGALVFWRGCQGLKDRG